MFEMNNIDGDNGVGWQIYLKISLVVTLLQQNSIVKEETHKRSNNKLPALVRTESTCK